MGILNLKKKGLKCIIKMKSHVLKEKKINAGNWKCKNKLRIYLYVTYFFQNYEVQI